MESFATAQESHEPENGGAKVDQLLTEYKQALMASAARSEMAPGDQTVKALGKADIAETLQWLEQNRNSLTPEQLKQHIALLDKSENVRAQKVAEYFKKVDARAQKGVISRDPTSVKKWKEYVKNLTTGQIMDLIKGDDLDDIKRWRLLAIFEGKQEIDGVRLPEAIRREHEKEFFDADFEEREKLVKKLAVTHKKLKADFLKLPPEMQEKYRAQFKACGLRDREMLLRALKIAKPVEKKEMSEQNERQKLLDSFEEQMADAVRDNLFSPLSIPPNMTWAKTLSLEKLRGVVHGKKSDLFLRMNERVAVRDGFYGLVKELPENQRSSWDLRFRNYDLDRRKPLVEELRGKLGKTGTQKTQGNQYSETALRHTLQTTLQDSSLSQSRLLFTMLKRSRVLRRRAEISTDAKKTDVIAEKTAEKGAKVDEARVIYLADLRQYGEARFHLKNYLKPKQQSDAKATNMTLLNERKEAVTAEQFQELVENHQKAELTAAWVALACERLPGADISKLRQTAEKIDPTVDLLKVAA